MLTPATRLVPDSVRPAKQAIRDWMAGVMRYYAYASQQPPQILPHTPSIRMPRIDEAIHDLLMAVMGYYVAHAHLAMEQNLRKTLWMMRDATQRGKFIDWTILNAAIEIISREVGENDPTIKHALTIGRLALLAVH